jgi:hypothetical protein
LDRVHLAEARCEAHRHSAMAGFAAAQGSGAISFGLLVMVWKTGQDDKADTREQTEPAEVF